MQENPSIFNEVENKIISIRNQQVLIDSDLAMLYGVQTRDINKAVKNNPDKFPNGYIFELSKVEFTNLRCKISTAKFEMTRSLPKVFTEKGLYMLATILKSPQAVKTSIAIIEAFARMKELSRSINNLVQEPKKEKQNLLLQKCWQVLNEMWSKDFQVSETESSIELNLAMLKIKHSVKQNKEFSKLKEIVQQQQILINDLLEKIERDKQ